MVALPAREQTLVIEGFAHVRAELPFPLRGVNGDNDSAFINDTVVDYCRAHALQFTRSRPYRKNDQAWVEQKNGSVVRRLVGPSAATCLFIRAQGRSKKSRTEYMALLSHQLSQPDTTLSRAAPHTGEL